MNQFVWALVGVAVLLLALPLVQRAAGGSRVAMLAYCTCCFVAPGLFAALLLGRQSGPFDGEVPVGSVSFQRSGSVFVTFHGLRAPFGKEFRIGGSETADFLVDRLPPDGDVGVIDAKGGLRVSTLSADGDHFTAIQGSLKDLTTEGSIPTWALEPGSSFCFAPAGAVACTDSKSWLWTLRSDGRLAVSRLEAGQRRESPACAPRMFVSGFPLRAFLGDIPSAQERVFPLDIYGRPDCAGDAVEDAGSSLDRTFLHFDVRGRLFISQLPGVRAERPLVVLSGLPVARAGSAASRFDVSIVRLQSGSPLDRVESKRRFLTDTHRAEAGRSRLVRMATLKVEFLASAPGLATPDTIQVRTQRPAAIEVQPTMTCRQSSVINLLGAQERNRKVYLDDAPVDASARVPFLVDLGRIGARGSAIEVRRTAQDESPWLAHGCTSFSRSTLSVVGASGVVANVDGAQIVGLGAPDSATLLMSVAEYGVPGVWILGLLLLQALARAVARNALWKPVTNAYLLAAVLVVVDILLVLRIVIAIQEVAVQPHLDSSVSQALLSLLLFPIALEAVVIAVGRSSLRVRGIVGSPFARFGASGGPGVANRGWRAWMPMALVFAVPALHLLLALAGMREQIAGVRVTAILVPAYVVVFASLVAATRSPRPVTLVQRFPGWVLGICGALVLTAFVVARDVGAVITLTGALVALTLMVFVMRRPPGRPISGMFRTVYGVALVALSACVVGALLLYAGGAGLGQLPKLLDHPALWVMAVLAGLMAVAATSRWRTRTAWIFAAPGALVILVLVGLSTARFDRTPVVCDQADLVSLAKCHDEQSLDTNRLRLSYLIYPALTRLNLTGEARGINSVFDELRWLTNDEYPGGGLMSVPPRMGLDRHDNAIATHIIGPQGRASAYLLCAMLLLPLMFMVLGRSRRRRGFLRPMPWIAYGCFAFTSVYMILGNLMLVPFTGRNVYLTNSFSGTDLLEGGLLILLVLMPLAAETRLLRGRHDD